ncbi:MAG: hypothetical protein AB7V44_34380, partial [Pseudonocardia sp.]
MSAAHVEDPTGRREPLDDPVQRRQPLRDQRRGVEDGEAVGARAEQPLVLRAPRDARAGAEHLDQPVRAGPGRRREGEPGEPGPLGELRARHRPGLGERGPQAQPPADVGQRCAECHRLVGADLA